MDPPHVTVMLWDPMPGKSQHEACGIIGLCVAKDLHPTSQEIRFLGAHRGAT